ncbi:uncharacterized protein LOC144427355 [Styela clava]
MKNHKNLNLDGLLVPDAEVAKDLLEWMLQFVPRKRPIIQEVLSHKYMAPPNVKGSLFRDLQEEFAPGRSQTSIHDELLLPHFKNGTFKSDLPTKKKTKSHSSQVATSLSKLVNNFHFAKYLEAKERNRKAALNSKNCIQLTDGILWYKTNVVNGGLNFTVYEGQRKLPNSVTEPLAIWVFSPLTEGFFHKLEAYQQLPPHPNLISVIASGRLRGTSGLFIATERCQFQTVDDYYEERKKNKISFDPRLALVHAKQLVSGLQHLHKHNTTHGILETDILFSLDMQNVKICVQNYFPFSPIYNSSFKNDILFLGHTLYKLWSNKLIDREEIILDSTVPMDPSALLIPNPDLAFDLITRMIHDDEDQRLTIQHVVDHEFWKSINI